MYLFLSYQSHVFNILIGNSDKTSPNPSPFGQKPGLARQHLTSSLAF